MLGSLLPTGLRPSFLPKFKRHGIELSDDLFGTPSHAMYGIDKDEPLTWARAEEA